MHIHARTRRNNYNHALLYFGKHSVTEKIKSPIKMKMFKTMCNKLA